MASWMRIARASGSESGRSPSTFSASSRSLVNWKLVASASRETRSEGSSATKPVRTFRAAHGSQSWQVFWHQANARTWSRFVRLASAW